MLSCFYQNQPNDEVFSNDDTEFNSYLYNYFLATKELQFSAFLGPYIKRALSKITNLERNCTAKNEKDNQASILVMNQHLLVIFVYVHQRYNTYWYVETDFYAYDRPRKDFFCPFFNPPLSISPSHTLRLHNKITTALQRGKALKSRMRRAGFEGRRSETADRFSRRTLTLQ